MLLFDGNRIDLEVKDASGEIEVVDMVSGRAGDDAESVQKTRVDWPAYIHGVKVGRGNWFIALKAEPMVKVDRGILFCVYHRCHTPKW